MIHNAFRVAEDNVLPLHAQPHIVLGAGDARSSGAVEDDADFPDVFANHFQSIQQSRARDDCSSVLIVVENGNLHRLAEGFFNLEAVRGFDVFEIDSPEGGLEQLAELDDFFGIVAVDFNVEYVDVGEALEKDGLAFHDRLARKRSDIAEAEHRGAVAEHCHQISTSGVFVSILRVLLNFEAGLGHSRSVGQTQIALGTARLGGCDFNLSGARPIVIVEGLLLAD